MFERKVIFRIANLLITPSLHRNLHHVKQQVQLRIVGQRLDNETCFMQLKEEQFVLKLHLFVMIFEIHISTPLEPQIYPVCQKGQTGVLVF
jgi:hypothetical protein